MATALHEQEPAHRRASVNGGKKLGLEEVLGSRTRVRILNALAAQPRAWQTMYSVRKTTGFKNGKVREDLADLAASGRVEEDGNILLRKYRLNLLEDKVRAYLDFLTRAAYFELRMASWNCSPPTDSARAAFSKTGPHSCRLRAFRRSRDDPEIPPEEKEDAGTWQWQ